MPNSMAAFFGATALIAAFIAVPISVTARITVSNCRTSSTPTS
jgi:hypothetical protein